MGAELAATMAPGVLALGWALVHAVWQGAAIVAAYAVLRPAIRAPRARVALGHLALLALAAVPLISFLHDRSAAPAGFGEGRDPLVMSALAVAGAEGFQIEAWLPWLVAAWSGGVLLLCLRQIVQWRALRRLCRRAEALGDGWPERFTALQARVGVRFRVGLRQSAEVALPMLVGLLRPTILMPAGLVLRLPADRVELILLHELAHLRRLDPLFNLLQTVVETLLFFHPAVHWLARRLREDRELCCDEIVLAHGADPLCYARVLLTLAETQALPAPALALAAGGGALMHRIQRIVDVPEAAQAAPRALGPVGAMLGVALVGAMLLQSQSRWAAMEPLPFGFGHVRLAFPTRFAPQVPDLAPSLAGAVVAPPRVEAAVDALDVPRLPVLPRPAIEDATPVAAPAFAQAGPPREALALPAPVPFAQDAAPATAEPRVRRAPVYPQAARERGIEGFVMLTYRIDLDGRPFDVGVEGRPDEGFEAAARSALLQWRFDPAAATMQAQKVRFDFRLDEAPAPASAAENAGGRPCRPTTGSRLCRPMRDSGMHTVVLSRS